MGVKRIVLDRGVLGVVVFGINFLVGLGRYEMFYKECEMRNL